MDIDQLLFLEIMRKSTELRSEYEYIKHLLEGEFPDARNMYREMKSLFISGVLDGYRLTVLERKEG